MGEVRSALDAFAVEDLHGLTDGLVLDRITELVQVVNAASAELSRAVRHAELTQAVEHDGMKSVRSWLIGHGLLAPSEAGRVVRVGRALEHLPAVAAGFAAGEITAAKVDVIAVITAPDKLAAAAEQGVDLSAIDTDLAQLAAVHLHEKVVETVQRYCAGLDPDGPEPDPTEGRRLTIARHADGARSFRGDLDAVGGEKFEAALESIVQAHRPDGDVRTRAQQLADALVQLCDNQLASGQLPTLRTVKPHLIVTLDVEDFADPATGHGAAETGFGARISAERARWLACDAAISRVVMGPGGTPLDLGRSHRVVTPGLRRAVVARDKTCVFAGCGAPHWWADVHHLVHWVHGGETNLENSALLCERHHTRVHHGFRVERPPDGRWRTYRPDDTEILIGPRL